MKIEHQCPACASAALRPATRASGSPFQSGRGFLTLTCACGEGATVSTAFASGSYARELSRLGWTVRVVET